MRKILVAALAFMLAPAAIAWPLDDEECDQGPFPPIIPECPAPEDDPPLPPLIPPGPPNPDPDVPPTITPVSQISTVAAAVAEVEMLVDWYLTGVLEDLSGAEVSISAIESHLQAFADAEAQSQPSYYRFIPAENRVLNVKIRILTANHAEFSNGSSLPPDFVALINRAMDLELAERGLEEASP